MNDGLLTYCLSRLPAKKAELEAVAKGSGVPYRTLLKIRRGDTTNPRIQTVQRLYDYLRAA